MKEWIKDYNNYTCFTFYENEQSCVITVYNNENVLCQKIVSKEEGRKNLVTFCLFWRCLEPVPYLDTVALINSDNVRGFVRYMRLQDIIKDLKHDLIPNSSLEMNILGNNREEKGFYFTFQVDVKRYFSYTISQYMKKHESMSIQGTEEDSNQIILDGIEFPMKLLNKEQREYFMSKIREEKNRAYQQFLGSPLNQKLNQSLEEQDSIQLVRKNPNVLDES